MRIGYFFDQEVAARVDAQLERDQFADAAYEPKTQPAWVFADLQDVGRRTSPGRKNSTSRCVRDVVR